MRCQACGRQIGWLRALLDREYCSESHRRGRRKLSARALRDALGDNELEGEERGRPGGGVLGAIGIFLAAAFLVLLLTFGPSGGGTPLAKVSSARPLELPQNLGRALPGSPSIALREEFTRGLEDWIGNASGSAGWSVRAGRVQPRGLLLWKPTLTLADYELSFETQIEKKGMGWAFRASGEDDYYAVKLRLTAPRTGRAEIVRWVVAGGRRSDPVTLPVPVRVEEHRAHLVQMRVRGDGFAALIDGQTVDAWHDKRHPRGGVGFFSDAGESASLHWVKVTNTGRLLDRFFTSAALATPLAAPGGGPH